MNRFESRKIAEAITSLFVGKLPPAGERPPVIKVRQVRVRVLRPAFYHQDRVPEVGEQITVGVDDAAGLVMRGLAEKV